MSSASTTQIPGDAPGRAKFLYHAKHDGAKRVDLKDKDVAEAQIRQLMAEGWTEKRTAVMLYHEQLAKDGKVFRSDADIATAKKNGWQAEPINHPHAQDPERLIYLQMQDAGSEVVDESSEPSEDAAPVGRGRPRKTA